MGNISLLGLKVSSSLACAFGIQVAGFSMSIKQLSTQLMI